MRPADPSSDALHLRLINDLQELRRLRDEAEAFAVRNGVPQRRRLDLRLALEETVVNVIRHAHAGGRHDIDVRLARAGNELVVRIEDHGRPFNPLGHPPFDPDTPLEQRGGGGMGIHMVRQVTDDLAYERRDGRNVLVLTIRW
jgi:anti-sigma regulatory factor (Ser/Thr protein kinase)